MTPEGKAKLKQLIALHEGFRSHIYKDSRGFNTIGYGTNLDAGLSEKNASDLAESKNEENAYKLYYYLPFFKDLSENRQIALLDMCYNLGIEGFLMFHKTLFALECHDYERASDEMLKSNWAQEVGERATTLANIIRTGEI